MKILGVVIGRNENITLQSVVDRIRSYSIPFIAIMDNPTDGVRWALRHAIDAYECPRQNAESHTYCWQRILDLMDWAIRRPRGYDWVFRVDADELWPDIRNDIELAELNGHNVINFGIVNHSPSVDIFPTNGNFQQLCSSSKETDPLFLERKGMPYQRAWKLDGSWKIDNGGHIIRRDDQSIYESDSVFHHYPALDRNSLVAKANRSYSKEERKRGWHFQYDKFLKTEEPSTISVQKKNGRLFRVFYHVAMMNRWKKLREEQKMAMAKYGVLQNAELHECFVGKETDLPEPIGCDYGGPISCYEYPTLQRLWNFCRENPSADPVLYIHTKGVSRGHVHANRWRLYMEWAVLENWIQCTEALQSGEYDLAGTEWSEGHLLQRNLNDNHPTPIGFFAGNFWWANPRFIASLPNPVDYTEANRFWAEAWVGCGPTPRVLSLHDTRAVFGGKRGWQILNWRRFHYANPDGSPVTPPVP